MVFRRGIHYPIPGSTFFRERVKGEGGEQENEVELGTEAGEGEFSPVLATSPSPSRALSNY